MHKLSRDAILRMLQEMRSEEVLRFVLDEIGPRASSLYQASLLLRDETEGLSAEEMSGLYNALVGNSERLNKRIDGAVRFVVLGREEQSKEARCAGQSDQI